MTEEGPLAPERITRPSPPEWAGNGLTFRARLFTINLSCDTTAARPRGGLESQAWDSSDYPDSADNDLVVFPVPDGSSEG
jgi:hypothetical protein